MRLGIRYTREWGVIFVGSVLSYFEQVIILIKESVMKPGYKGKTDDKQSIFDFVFRFMLDQKERAHERGTCKYRLGKLCCGVGCLISDDELTPEIADSGGILSSFGNPISKYLSEKGYDLVFLQGLQGVHDCAVDDFVSQFKLEMKNLALRYDLKYEEVSDAVEIS